MKRISIHNLQTHLHCSRDNHGVFTWQQMCTPRESVKEAQARLHRGSSLDSSNFGLCEIYSPESAAVDEVMCFAALGARVGNGRGMWGLEASDEVKLGGIVADEDISRLLCVCCSGYCVEG